jgi:Paraquat-inducible protein B
VRKLDAVPYARIGNHLDRTLRSTQQLLDQLRTQLAPQATRTLDQAQKTLDAARSSLISPQAPLQQNASRTLIELDRAARSLRGLADYLRRHPQSLLRGAAPDAPPPQAEESR